MMTPQDRQEQIEAFVRNQLDETTVKAVQDKMASDKKYAMDVNIQRDLYNTFKSKKALDFRKQLDGFREFPKTKKNATEDTKIKNLQPQARVRSLGSILSIAASILAITIAGFLMYNNIGSSGNIRDLVAQKIDLPKDIHNAKKGNEDIEGLEKQVKNTWVVADKAYRAENYQTALLELDKIEQLDPDFKIHVQGNYFYKRAVVLLQLGQSKEALEAFDRSIELNTNFTNTAKWQRTLTLLLLENREDEARQALQNFVNEGGARATDAKVILNSL